MGDQTESLELIRTLEDALASTSGKEFFVALVKTLADALDVHCAFVTEFSEDNTIVHPLAMWCDRRLQPPKPYPIAGTPCEAVLNGEPVGFEQGVIDLFPDDREGLTALQAESFLAIPLKGRSGRVVGHIALMDSRPRTWPHADVDALRLVAARALAEVERRQLQAELTETNRLLEARVLERTRELAAANEQLLRQIEQERRLSESLTASEAGFRAVFEHSPVSIWELDLARVRTELDSLNRQGITDAVAHLRTRPDMLRHVLGLGSIRRFNSASLALFRIADPQALIGRSLARIPRSMRSGFLDMLAELLAGTFVGHREVRERRRDGSVLVCRAYWSLPPGYDASWSRLLISFVDLTEQTRVSDALAETQTQLESRVADRTAELSAVNNRLRHEIARRARIEQALKESEAAYRDLYENAPNVYWSTGSDGLIRRANARASQLFGYRPEEFVNKPIVEMLADTLEGKGVGQRVFQRFLDGDATRGQEVEFRAADGRSVWADVNVEPIFDAEGRPIATRSMLTDVTARKQAQRDLARRVALDHMVLEVSTVLAGMGAANLRTELSRVLSVIGEQGAWDAVALHLLSSEQTSCICWQAAGATRPTPAPLDPATVETLADLDRPLWWPSADGAAAELGMGVFGAPSAVGSGLAAPLKRGGRLLGVLLMTTGPDRQAGLTPQDAHTVALLTELFGTTLVRCATEEELVAAKSLAETASKAKTDFLASMSHELRTPLNVILGYTQLLRRKPELGPSVQDHLAPLQRSGELLLQLIDDVLELARVESGKITIEPNAVDLEAFTSDIARMFTNRITARGMQFELAVTPPVPSHVVVDGRRLQQVLINLLGNAIKFSEAGTTITLAVASAPLGPGRVELTFNVTDQGMGIPESELERVFEPFVQLAEQSGDGVGLGLAITRTLVGALNGRISVTSTPAEGSTFSVSVPAQETGPTDDTAAVPFVVDYVGRRRCVLLVDDHAENRAFLKAYLSGLGFELLEAGDGAAAIDIARLRHPDLALIDLVMPVLDGFETIRRLRALDTAGTMRIIAVSASAFDTDRLASVACGSDAFLPKPLDLALLTDTIADLLDLDWLRDDRAVQDGPRVSSDSLLELARAADLGDVAAIDAWLEKASATAPGHPLVTRVRELLDQFDVRAIQRMARRAERES